MRDIAARVRAIVVGRYDADLRVAAAELGVVEFDLRTLIELRAPPLSDDALADLLTGVVRHFGIDPAWLLTGRYVLSSHAEAEEVIADTRALRGQIERLLRTPQADRPVEIERVLAADREGGPVKRRSRPPHGDRPAPATEEASPRGQLDANAEEMR
ncbi:MAG: hypothetical protein M3303_16265 [Gemmatimonadota bacterium]|nr:hypothetical protein [Gemmatimonadota bacterium]